ncbi:DUF3667 domain-containing protein [Elongatibacter sediminis]|uniref:DUF3667 domain-containing protein n=1 Tax=Elongatibacter sediminis TaxID=3119006 RepID=A0AAW9RHG4_9GAMM
MTRTDPVTQEDPEGSSGYPVTTDRGLTLPARRLKGSPACLNCGTPLQGPFCHYCGQPDRHLLRFFPVLLRELLEDFIDLDSRFMRTLRPLLFHPGRLTRDYLDGRRFRYTPPLRLYIFSSMVFFILAATLAGNAIDVTMQDGDEAPDIQLQIGDYGENGEDDEPFTVDGEPWDRETNPFIVPGMPDFINDWINDEIEESPQKERQIEANPNLIVEQMFDVLPIAVFVMLPLVALLFKFWYLFARRYYVEHLIHALHNHAFLFVVFTLTLIADSLAEWLDPSDGGRVSRTASIFTMIMLAWIPLYLLISLKTVYRQGWILTGLKFSAIGLSYLVLLLSVASGVALLSFVLL